MHETSNRHSKVAARAQINAPSDASLDNTAAHRLLLNINVILKLFSLFNLGTLAAA